MYKYIFLLLSSVLPVFLFAKVNVVISGGIDDATCKANMEKTMSLFLTKINETQAKGEKLNFRGTDIPDDVQINVSMLWDNCPFQYIDENIVEKCVRTYSGYQVRNIPLEIHPTDITSSNVVYQEAAFNFDRKGNVESFFFTLDNKLYKKILRENSIEGDFCCRQFIIDYVEHFYTSYCQKDIRYFDSLIYDKSLMFINDGSKSIEDDSSLSDKEQIMTLKKDEYIKNLQSIFDTDKYINVNIDELDVMRHPVNKYIYGVTLHQSYTSECHPGSGYIFMLWDFRRENEPQLLIFTWQPDYINGRKLPKDEVFSLSDFDI